MKSSRAAIRYAKALIQESIEVDSLESMYSDMQVVLNTFQENDNLKFLVESRVVKNSLKLSTLKLIFKNLSKLSLKFIDVLSENNRVVSKLTNKQTILENKIDKTLIGGFILRVGDVEYNSSFKNKLKTIKQVFTKNTNLSIQ